MKIRLTDLFIGLSIGYYLKPTFILFGVTIPWVVVGLGICLILPLLKKLCRILWKKMLKKIAKDLQELSN